MRVVKKYSEKDCGIEMNTNGEIVVHHNHSLEYQNTVQINGCIGFFKTYAAAQDQPIEIRAAAGAAAEEDKSLTGPNPVNQRPRPPGSGRCGMNV